MKAPQWTESEISLLEAAYPTSGNKTLATLLPGRTYLASKSMATKLGLKKAPGFHAKTNWTPELDSLLLTIYPDRPTSEIAAAMGISACSVNCRATSLGLKKSAEYMAALTAETTRKLSLAGAGTRIKKGSVPPNKGRRQTEYMTPEAIERTRATRFRSGQDPHNSKSMGSARLNADGYFEIKVRHVKGLPMKNLNYLAVHRVIYEKLHGPLPDGIIVVFADGNPMNLAHDNLVAMTRAEHLERNRLSDGAILKRQLKIRNPEKMEEIRRGFPHLIEISRKILLTKRKINELSGKG